MICGNCTNLGKRFAEVATFKERVHLLTCIATMRKYLDANVNTPHEDKEVSSSLTTKILLSFDEGPRQQLLQMLRQSAGIEITLKSCPHGVLGVLS